MRITEVKMGQKVEFPIDIAEDGTVVFKEILSRNRHMADLTTIVGAHGKAKNKVQEYIARGSVELTSFEASKNDILLRARRTSVGLFILGFRITKINKEEKICSAVAFFAMYDGHFDGKEIQDNLYEPLLNLIVRIQKFQFML